MRPLAALLVDSSRRDRALIAMFGPGFLSLFAAVTIVCGVVSLVIALVHGTGSTLIAIDWSEYFWFGSSMLLIGISLVAVDRKAYCSAVSLISGAGALLVCLLLSVRHSPTTFRTAERAFSYNSLASIVLAGIALLFIASRLRRTFRSPALSLVGVIIIGLGGAEIFGHFASLPVSYSLNMGTQVSPWVSIGIISLGAGVTILAWNSYREVERSSQDLWRAMTTYFTCSALVISVMSALFVALPFHKHTQQEIENQLVRLTESKAQTLEQYFLLAREVATQSSVILDQVLPRLPLRSRPSQPVALSEYVSGAARFDSMGRLLFHQGLAPSSIAQFSPTLHNASNQVTILGLSLSQNEYVLVVAVTLPGVNPDETYTDLFAFSADPIKKVLQRDRDNSPISELYFGNTSSIDTAFSFDTHQNRFTVPYFHLSQYLSQIISRGRLNEADRIRVFSPESGSRIAVYVEINGTSFYIISSASARDVHLPPVMRVLEFTTWGIVLSLLIAVGSFLIVRELMLHIEKSQRSALSAQYLKEAIFGAAADAVFTCREDGHIQSMNRAARILFQLPEEKELAPSNISSLLTIAPDQASSILESLRRHSTDGESSSIELEGRTTHGTSIPLECTVSFLKRGDESLFIIFARDITQRRQAEGAIQKSLAEKDLLLREIHHRVKNNLQVISSLLKLQSNSVESAEAATALGESHSRIRSIALIHEHLYQSDTLAYLDFGNYLERLCKELAYSYGRQFGHSVKVDAPHAALSLDLAIPSGLLVTELVTNALKHAFPDRSGGIVSVRFEEPLPEQYVLTVSDNGVGFEDSETLRKRKSLGLKLIERLSQQIEATMTRRNDNGTHYTFEFTLLRRATTHGEAANSHR